MPGYLVCEELGAGARATVWAGSREDGLDVALKVVHGGAGDAQARQEAEVLLALRIDHLVRLHDVLPLGPDLVLVLDLLRGGTLADLVSARGHLTPGECVTVLTPVLGALGRLHRAGVAHADVSPGNILFDLQGRPHLGDLGEAVLAGRVVEDLGATLGFVAPEVLLGERPGPASDVYAVGALGRFALTGAPPPSPLAGPASPPTGDSPGDVVLRLCLEAMANDPEQRPDADALAVALYEATDAQPLHLVSAADPTADVTRRLRELVGATAPAQEPVSSAKGRGRMLRRPVSRRGSGRPGPAAAGVGRQGLGSQGLGHQGLGRLRGRVRAASLWQSMTARVALGCAVSTAIVALVVALAGNPSQAQADAATSHHTGSPSVSASDEARQVSASSHPAASTKDATSPSAMPPPAASPAPAAPAAPGAASQRVDVEAVVAQLARTRAALWADPTAGDLAMLDARSSAAWEQDAADRSARAGLGMRLEGLSFEVVSAQLEGPGALPAGAVGDRMTVRVALRTSAHTERTTSETRAVPSSVADPVLLDLVLTDGGWRIERVRAVP